MPNFVRIAGDLTADVPLYACTRRHAYLRTGLSDTLQRFRTVTAMRVGRASAYKTNALRPRASVACRGPGGMNRCSSLTFKRWVLL